MIFVNRALAFALVACGSSHPPTATLPPQPSSSATVKPVTIAAPPASKHELRRVERRFTVEKLASTQIPWDVQVRGEHDAALLASIEGATHGWTHASLRVSPRGDRFVVVGSNASTAPAFVLFDSAGKKLVSHVANAAFFALDGDLVYAVGTQLYALGATTRTIGGPQSALCFEKTCGKWTTPIAATAGAAQVLVARIGGGFVHDDDVFVLDPMTGATTTLVAPSKKTAFLGGEIFGTGRYCTYEMPYSKSPDDFPHATLECSSPPWTEMKAIFETEGGAMSIGDVGGRVVTGMATRLDVLDGEKHVTYTPPEGGALPIALTDGRTVAIEGRDVLVLVDVVDETYAVVTGVPTVVMPLEGHVKAFIATGDGTASIVRYE